MSAANVLHASALATGLQGILKTAHVDAGLRAKFCHVGDLAFLPTVPTWLDDKLPCILIRPSDEGLAKTSLGPNWRGEETITLRIVFVNAFNAAGGEDVPASKMAAAQSLVCTLMDNYLLSGVTLSNGTKRALEVVGVEYTPQEEAFVGQFRGDLYAIAISARVVVSGITSA